MEWLRFAAGARFATPACLPRKFSYCSGIDGRGGAWDVLAVDKACEQANVTAERKARLLRIGDELEYLFRSCQETNVMHFIPRCTNLLHASGASSGTCVYHAIQSIITFLVSCWHDILQSISTWH